MEALLIGQQHKPIGADHDRHLSSEKVVVAERNLLGCGRIVLIHDRHNPPFE